VVAVFTDCGRITHQQEVGGQGSPADFDFRFEDNPLGKTTHPGSPTLQAERHLRGASLLPSGVMQER